MSMAPRGPLPARVYWVRRGILLAVAVVLVVIIAKLLTGGSDGSEKASGSNGAVQLSGGGAKPSTTTSEAATDAAVPSGKVPLAQPSGPCDPEKVTITAEDGKYANDGKVEMVLQVGTSEDACTFSFSPKSVVVKIVSGDDPIWSSQQCSVLPTADVVAREAKPARVAFTWNGHRSDEDCSRSVAWAMPGTYHAIAATFGGEPSDTQFELTRPPGVVITKTAKPKVTATPTASATAKASTKTSTKTTAATDEKAGDPREP